MAAESWEDIDTTLEDEPQLKSEEKEAPELTSITESRHAELQRTMQLMDVLLQSPHHNARDEQPMLLIDWTEMSEGRVKKDSESDNESQLQALTAQIWEDLDGQLEELFDAQAAWHTTTSEVRLCLRQRMRDIQGCA